MVDIFKNESVKTVNNSHLRGVSLQHVLIFCLWMLALFIIQPFGEFPINDDWAYTKNVYNLTENGKFVIDLWPAMNLVSQTLYGSLFTFIFGFSFTVLRLSIFLLAIIASITFYEIVLKLAKDNKWLAFYITISFCFSALFCSLSFTFMTDIFFIAFQIFAIYNWMRYAQKPSWRAYSLFILFSIIAILNRQMALVFPLLMAGLILQQEGFSIKVIIKAILPIVLGWLAHHQFHRYIEEHHISNQIQNLDNLFNHLKKTRIETHFHNGGNSLFVAGWLLFPICLLKWFHYKGLKWFDVALLIGIAGLAWLMFQQSFSTFPMPNVMGIWEVGPHLVKGYLHQRAHSGNYSFLKYSEAIIAYLGLCSTLFFLIKKSNRTDFFSNKSIAWISFLGVITIYFLFIAVNISSFDRYVLPLSLLLILAIIPKVLNTSLKSVKITLIVIPLFTFLFSVVETRDFFMFQKVRWQSAEFLHSKGVKPNKMDGGFEYNGWYKPTESYPTDSRSWWWVENDDYVITNRPLLGYEIYKTYKYQRWLPLQKEKFYILRRKY